MFALLLVHITMTTVKGPKGHILFRSKSSSSHRPFFHLGVTSSAAFSSTLSSFTPSTSWASSNSALATSSFVLAPPCHQRAVGAGPKAKSSTGVGILPSDRQTNNHLPSTNTFKDAGTWLPYKENSISAAPVAVAGSTVVHGGKDGLASRPPFRSEPSWPGREGQTGLTTHERIVRTQRIWCIPGLKREEVEVLLADAEPGVS
ncbi:unnamed protein product [Protopolystoma xenopodis]|uniref:Uncharacterized protein n=1 Tax=Protopolystoma xenopodis TaxID=117903 RepID=A0A448WBQ4_9PLAT|nr:unnamed protein product [Protopolystoma xenopodis]